MLVIRMRWTVWYAGAYAPEDGRNYRPKHVELIEIINKFLFLRLVGVYIIVKFKVGLLPSQRSRP